MHRSTSECKRPFQFNARGPYLRMFRVDHLAPCASHSFPDPARVSRPPLVFLTFTWHHSKAYPYISRRLLTDKSPRMRDALKYMVYGKEGVLDVDRIIDLLQALEKFVAVKDYGDGSAFKVQ